MSTNLNAPAATVASSAWSPFRHPAFTVLWTATVVSNVGSWMYSAASGWLMTSLNPDPLIVAMVQVATSLPLFLFAMPAGALTDIVDRRRFLIVSEIVITVVVAIFAAIVWLARHRREFVAVHVPHRRGWGADRARLAGDRAATRPQAGPSARHRRQQRRRQYQPRHRSGFGRRHRGAVGHRGAILAHRHQQSRHRRRAAVVASTGEGAAAPAGGTAGPCHSHRPAACQVQPASAGHADPRRRVLPVRERVLGSASPGRAGADRRRTRSLWIPAGHDRGGGRGRRLCAAMAEGETRSRRPGRGRIGRHGACHGAVRAGARFRHRAGDRKSTRLNSSHLGISYA